MLSFPDGMHYIGKTIDFHRRMQSYKRCEGTHRYVLTWIRRYGWCNVQKRKLWEGDNEQLNEEEIRLIALKGTQWPEGLNATIGGEGDPEATRKQWQDPVGRAQRIRAITAAHQRNKAGYSEGMREHMANQTPEQLEARTGEASRQKRKATWDAKREAKLALLPPEVAAKKRRVAERHAAWFKRDGQIMRKRRTASCLSHPSCSSEGVREWLIPSDPIPSDPED